MAAHDLDAVFFVQSSPEIELREGMFYVCYEIGRSARFEVVLPPHVFLKALKRATLVAGEFHRDSAEVLAFHPKEAADGLH
jgi:hypothetical protein